MSNADKLMSLGAQCVGGDLIYKHKVLGSIRNGDLMLTPEGQALLAMDITDVEVKEVKPKKAKAKAEVTADAPTDEFNLDALLD